MTIVDHRKNKMELTRSDKESAEAVIEALQYTLKQRDAEIVRLKQEVHLLQRKNWITDACGDDMWDLD
ncbi:hypothetical protein [uncultured Tateyamaria sp.]|uniref:hypothetical protein n=1 Tax=uncultured Tateyamaria sp. TaxID=455651 RepID=UPI002607A752|nr:hypothetical protein [uncultured Tateyamaria sp.]